MEMLYMKLKLYKQTIHRDRIWVLVLEDAMGMWVVVESMEWEKEKRKNRFEKKSVETGMHVRVKFFHQRTFVCFLVNKKLKRVEKFSHVVLNPRLPQTSVQTMILKTSKKKIQKSLAKKW